ncbi:hypothetical protein G7D34_003710 [Salmonella enterica]|nr:hypothetical protein [Salmonella enterica]
MKVIVKLKEYTEGLKPVAYTGGNYHCYTSTPRIIYATIYTEKDRKEDIKNLLRESRESARASASRKHALQEAKQSYLQPKQSKNIILKNI